MAADLSTVTQRTTEILNACAAGTFSSTIASGNLDRNASAISQAVREAALTICRSIVSNPFNVHRNSFISTSAASLTHQGELPDMAGEGDLIQIQPYTGADWITGVKRDIQVIESYRSNPSNLYDSVAHNASGSRLSGYYAISNGRVYFTGYAARGYFPTFDRTTATSLIPDAAEGCWTALSVALTVKEGDNMADIAQYYMNFGMQELAAIGSNSQSQPLPSPDQARKNRGNV
jgi:hypothetical protein